MKAPGVDTLTPTPVQPMPKPSPADLETERFIARGARVVPPLRDYFDVASSAYRTGDRTGVRKACFDLSGGLLRYAFACALSTLGVKLEGRQLNTRLAKQLREAARLSDGSWARMARGVVAALDDLGAEERQWFDFLNEQPLAQWIEARNAFAHTGSSGEEALALASAVLDGGAPLFEAQLQLQQEAWLLRLQDRALPATPWLTEAQGRLHLPEAPHRAGLSWRYLDGRTGERHAAPELDAAVRRLCGGEQATPRLLVRRPGFVGRKGAQKRLEEWAHLAATGERVVGVVSGGRGVGRSRLLEELVEEAAALGFRRVLFGRGSGSRAAFETLRTAAERSGRGELLGAIDEETRGDSEATAEAYQALVLRLSRIISTATEPTLLAVDDVEDADTHSVRVLHEISQARPIREAAQAGPVFVLLSLRPGREHRELARLLDAVGPDRVFDLEPLKRAEAVSLLREMAPMNEQLVEFIIERAAGRPSLLVQAVLEAHDSNLLVWRGGRWDLQSRETSDRRRALERLSASDLLPRTLWSRLHSFFGEGSDSERWALQLLTAIAFVGGSSRTSTLDALRRTPPFEAVPLPRVVDALVMSELLLADLHQGVALDPPVLQEPILRAAEHRPWFAEVARAALTALETSASRPDAEIIAEGYFRLRDHLTGRDWFRKAVRDALRLGAFKDARRVAERWQQLDPLPQGQASAATLIADALLREGSPREASDAIAVGLALTAQKRLEQLQLRIQRVEARFALGSFAPADDATLLDDVDALGNASLRIQARLALASCQRTAASNALLDDAMELSLELSDADALPLRYRISAARLEALYEQGANVPALREAHAVALYFAERLGSRWVSLDQRLNMAVLLAEEGKPKDAATALSSVARQAKEAGLSRIEREALVNRAVCLRRAGRYEEAVNAARIAADAALRDGCFREYAAARSCEGLCHMHRSEWNDAEEALSDAIDGRRKAGDKRLALPLLRRATVRLASGQRDLARGDAREAAGHATAAGNEAEQIHAELLGAIIDDPDPSAATSPTRRAIARAQHSQARLSQECLELLSSHEIA